MIFQIMGIAILLVFYGCYFIKMINQRRKGIMTDQIGKGKTGVVKCIEITMKIATYLVPIVEVVSIILNTNQFPVSLRIAGVCVGIAGVTVFIISVLTMRDSWRAGVSKTDQTELVTRGIYQISRNPAFLGFDLVYIGIAMMFFNWVLFVVSIFAMIMFHLQIVNVEEEFLLEAFGEEYLSYRQKVCRYIGRKSESYLNFMRRNNRMITYRRIEEEELCIKLFDRFIRHQVVTKCWRKEEGEWVIKDVPFIDDWGKEEFQTLVSCLQNTIRTGGFVYGAFYEGNLKGFTSVESELFGGAQQYLDLSCIHVSEDMRGRGIGETLFAAAKDWAKKHGARKLYISGHSAVETQAFYKKMGCVEAELYNEAHVEKEPCDCQLECRL